MLRGTEVCRESQTKAAAKTPDLKTPEIKFPINIKRVRIRNDATQMTEAECNRPLIGAGEITIGVWFQTEILP